MRFWVSVLGLVIGLQTAFIAAASESFGAPGPAVGESGSAAPSPNGDVAPARESGDEPGVPASEPATERVRDHSTRSPQEMLSLFLKGTGALIVMVLLYKGLARWFVSRRQRD
ncbi:MAG: hypothetical protein NTAFB05_15320 [Nitrobacter sp.]